MNEPTDEHGVVTREYAVSLADFSHAVQALTIAKGDGVTWGRSILLSVLCLASAACPYLLTSLPSRGTRSASMMDVGIALLGLFAAVGTLVLPALIALLVSWLFVIRSIRRTAWLGKGSYLFVDADRVVASRRNAGLLLGAAVSVYLAAPAIGALARTGASFEAVVPLLLMIGFAGVLLFLRGRIGRLYHAQPSLQLTQQLSADANGMVHRDSRSRSEIAWDGVQGVVETSRMFLVFVSALAFHPIPKSAFASEGETSRFAELLRRFASTPSGGFPVGDARPSFAVVAGPPPLPPAGGGGRA